MFNVQVLNDAVAELSDAGKQEIQKMVDAFEEYKVEVERLTEVAEGFEQLSIQLQKDKDALQYVTNVQDAKITELINIISDLTPKETQESIKLSNHHV